MTTLKVNGKSHQVDAEPDTPLLMVLQYSQISTIIPWREYTRPRQLLKPLLSRVGRR